MSRSSEILLRRLFSKVLATALTTGVGTIFAVGPAGCGGSTIQDPGPGGGGGGSTPEFTSLCPSVGSGSLLSGLKATPVFDGAVTRAESAFIRRGSGAVAGDGGTSSSGSGDGDAWTGKNGESVGTLCGRASNRAACLEKVNGYRILPATRDACVATYPSSAYANLECGAFYILYTRGDEIAVARTDAEISALAGTFDTIEEALWVTTRAGYERSCGFNRNGMPDSQYRTTLDGGYDFNLLEYKNCGDATFKVMVHVDYAGKLTVVTREDLHLKPTCAVAGRRPTGFDLSECCERDSSGSNVVGAYFESMATLEAASVIAFQELGSKLRALGAPQDLIARVETAADDEVRHASATATLAANHGSAPKDPMLPLSITTRATTSATMSAASSELPSLLALALDNAREGCVRETYGALLAHVQMSRAADPETRAIMKTIADEETSHAALSWDLAHWFDTVLTPEQRALVSSERSEAFASLANEIDVRFDPRVLSAAGLPEADEARRLLEGLAPLMLAAA